MEDLSCPRCKSTKYRNPALKLMVNVCGHSLCEKCVELLFVRGSGKCETCQIPLRRANFRMQMFEDADVEKDTELRKKILKDFNKKETDFATLREYNDYLEQVETITFNLTYGIDIEQTKLIIEKYKQENQDFIKKNRLKLSRDEIELEKLIAEQEMEHFLFIQNQMEEEQFEKKQKQKHKDELINDLMFSDLPANRIVESHRKEILLTEKTKSNFEKPTKFATGILMDKRDSNGPIQPVNKATSDSNNIYTYSPLSMEIKGPSPPNLDELNKLNYLNHIRQASDQELAGGFKSVLSCQRALQDAFSGLYIFLDSPRS